MHTNTSSENSFVLFIEKNSEANKELRRVLSTANFHCVTAMDEREALDSMQAHNPDLVLVDMSHAGHKSADLIHALRSRAAPKWLPVLALLRDPDDTHAIQALSAGACSYLVEPVNPQVLLATVQNQRNFVAFQAKAAQQAQLKDEFLATVSHELRTPITSVVGAMALLVSGKLATLPPAALEIAKIAKKNGDRLTRLIDDVLDLAKLESDRMEVQLQLCDLGPLLAASVEAIAYYERRLEVSVVLAQCPASAPCWVDANRFLQVMSNLLSNAIKHSPRGKEVSIRLLEAHDGWCIEVQDQGCGIDPAFQAQLFKRFAQAPGNERRHAGSTGLGLYISRMLVERMGGQISASSQAGQGSVFRITLPKGVAHA